MIKYLLSLAAVLGLTHAFHTAALVSRNVKLFSMAETSTDEDTVTYFEDLDRAVKCATEFGLCNVETLHRLADKVESGSDSCVFEVDAELCQKETDDRVDVAEVLRLQAELQLRMEAIELSSLFAADVKDEHDIREREDFMDILTEDSM